MTISELKAFGANTEEGLGRCLNNEDFYFRMIKMALADAGFEKLKTAIEQNDLDAGFDAAHALKGVLGNLSLTPLYKPVSEMTELLRSKEDADYSAYVKEIVDQREALRKICEA